MSQTIPSTVRLGDRSTVVARWQAIAGVVADGVFGPKTNAATRAWQQAHGLTPDGVVGPMTWAVALATKEQRVNTNTTDLDDNFFPRLLDVCEGLKCAPEDLLGVMMSESGIKATAHNPAGNASGLIQFMPATLKGLGFAGTHADLRKLSATEQLGWVERYYQSFPAGKPWDSAGRLYQATFLPGTLGAGRGADTVVCAKGGKLAFAYDANPGFDRGRKGTITVGDLTASVQRACKGARWNEVLARLADAKGGDAA